MEIPLLFGTAPAGTRRCSSCASGVHDFQDPMITAGHGQTPAEGITGGRRDEAGSYSVIETRIGDS